MDIYRRLVSCIASKFDGALVPTNKGSQQVNIVLTFGLLVLFSTSEFLVISVNPCKSASMETGVLKSGGVATNGLYGSEPGGT